MKYMGSKRIMLSATLGRAIAENCPTNGNVFADLFAGSGVVSWHVAEKFPVRVIASDLQAYSKALTGAVIERTNRINASKLWDEWAMEAAKWIASRSELAETIAWSTRHWEQGPKGKVQEIRRFCRTAKPPIVSAYGGHYFSPYQALVLDALRATVPTRSANFDTYIAALVTAAAECSASPGHTAQPFQATKTASVHLFEAWRRDAWSQTRRAFISLGSRRAKKVGTAQVAPAITVASQLGEGDVAFIDPPYSGVHYSRFYHVLETVAKGMPVRPKGVGRYPALKERPQSDFSSKARAEVAFSTLIQTLANKGTGCIVTYPDKACSNGLSGEAVCDITAQHYRVARESNPSVFSTLGGNGSGRDARIKVAELVLVCRTR